VRVSLTGWCCYLGFLVCNGFCLVDCLWSLIVDELMVLVFS